jgi:hypothetical protein
MPDCSSILIGYLSLTALICDAGVNIFISKVLVDVLLPLTNIYPVVLCQLYYSFVLVDKSHC